ncbi:MAG: hypothetical protein KGH75_02485 [Rhodospirillales bacterium]|nr:hypothetical protein [Rhodospirillales bacterium]
MRYRKLDANGDYSFGHSQANFYANQVEAVAQAVSTRLKLWAGEWFTDTSDGTPWRTEVLGKYTAATYDTVLKARILGTPGVTQLNSYSSSIDPNARALTVRATISTAYGISQVTTTL